MHVKLECNYHIKQEIFIGIRALKEIKVGV